MHDEQTIVENIKVHASPYWLETFGEDEGTVGVIACLHNFQIETDR